MVDYTLRRYVEVADNFKNGYAKRRICEILNSYGNILDPAVQDMLTLLRLTGAEPAYDWVFHRKEFFYPTEADAILEEEHQEACWDYE